MSRSDRPTVSIIIAARNAQETLPACLTSLRQLTYPPAQVETIVVDNASNDGTRAIAESFDVRVVCEEKRGAGAARNRGLASTSGAVVAFTDADCVVEPDWLTELIPALQDPEVGLAGGAIQAARPCNSIELFGEQIHNHQAALEQFRPPYAMAANCALPRALVERLGGFDESLLRGQDVDLAWRILQAGRRLAYRARAIVWHRNEKTLRGLFRQAFRHGYSSILVHRKHQTFLARWGYRRVSSFGLRQLLWSAREYQRTRSIQALCNLTFHAGKGLGKALGSARYRYLDL